MNIDAGRSGGNRADRALAMLRSHPQGVCLSDVPFEDGYAFRNAVSSLRASGIPIRSERCRVHAHRGSVSRYALIQQAEQQEMSIA